VETTILGLASLALAIVLTAVGIAGLAERLPRTRRAVATPARQHEPEQRARRRAASVTLVGAAGPPLLLGVALLVRPPDQLDDWFLIYALAGVVTGGLIAYAKRRADPAAGPEDARSAHDEEHP
jgi:hypothetical protein